MDMVKDLQYPQNHVEYRVARSREELEKAYALVYREYYKKAYTVENPFHLRLSIYNALPQTTTFVALNDKGEVTATATIIPDSSLGLPMDTIFSEDLNRLRQQNKKICEISMLASETDLYQHASLSHLLKQLIFIFSLFKVLLDYVRDVLKLDYICITINPKYSLIFELILFKDLGGGLKSFPEVNGAPAIAKYLDVHTIVEGCSKPGNERLYEIFVAQQTDQSRFSQKIELTPEDLRYFFLEKSKVFETAPASQLEFVRCCYGGSISSSPALSR